MRRLGVALAGLLFMTMLAQTGAIAARENDWCAEDPLFFVLGSQFRVTTTIAAPASAVDSVAYVVELPSNADPAIAKWPNGQPIPTTVEFRYNGPAYDGTSATFSVKVTVVASGPADAAVTADVSGPSVATSEFTGRTNKKLSFQLDVAAK